jgi:N-acetylglucosamine-6-phosphate deacetylase
MRHDTISGRDPATGRAIKVTIEAGRVVAIEAGPAGESRWLTPGFVDLQVNGYAGHDLNGPALRPETLGHLARALRATGTTSFVPTIITAPEERIVAALGAIAQARAADPLLHRAIPYVHVEGPHISPHDGPRGAHPVEHVRPPDVAEFTRWQAACGGLVGMVTLSPHFPGACAYIAALTGSGVYVAIGHTDATPQQIVAAADAGAALSTHLGNGAAARMPRHPNLIWAQLAEDRLGASFIADGHHLPAATLKSMLRAKAIERSILVSDAVALAGLAPGIYEAPVGGKVELTADGRLGLAGTPFLAGAARPLSAGIAFVAGFCGVTLGDAVRLATGNPGRFAGGRGTLRLGAPADLVRFRWQPGERDLQIETVLVAGKETWLPKAIGDISGN